MKVNEIFYSLQGEGAFTGTPAVFVRFSGCNLQCSFCDTQHQTGEQMTEKEIVAEVLKYNCTHVVLTGGEPMLQINSKLLALLHANMKFVQVETNGTVKPSCINMIDWITCSPKYRDIKIDSCHEVKVVYPNDKIEEYARIPASCYYVQPCDVPNPLIRQRNLEKAVEYIKEHPKWRLSLQTQKLINVK